jgi:hypothetical protein
MEDRRYSNAGSETFVGVPTRWSLFGGDPTVGEM